MSSSIIRAAIGARLSTIPDIGLVHTYQRYAQRQRDFRTFYETAGTVRGWNVHRIGFRQRPYTAGVNVVLSRWRIEGFHALDDETETEILFDDMIDSINDAFLLDPTIGGTVNSIEADNQVGIQLDDAGPAMFSGVLCHRARLSLQTEHYQSFEVEEVGTVPNAIYASRSPNIGNAHKEDYRNVSTGEPPDE